MLEIITKINDFVNNIVWGWPAIILLAFVGVLMTILTKGFQITHIGHWFKKTLGAIFKDRSVTGHTKDKSISQFQSLCTALAGTVGTGNIVGVAGAIMIGGPGAVFWMWVIAIFGMMTKFSENVLGILYRKKNEKGEWSGGAMYYLRDGLGAKKHCKTLGKVLAIIFALCCLLASFGIGNMTQVNSISGNLETTFNIPTWVSGIIVLILVGIVVIGGLKRIANVTEKIVPFMVIIYVISSIIILCMNITEVPAVFASIFKGAFGLEAAAGGVVGYGIKLAIEQGCKRGVFSNEAGLGSAVLVHSNSNVKEPVRQGMWGIFEVFADTIVVCTLTAFTILSSGYVDLTTGAVVSEIDGITVTKANLISLIYTDNFGLIGGIFITIAVSLFAYSTILGWNQYGTKACEYLFGVNSTIVYRVIFTAFLFAGAVMSDNIAWDIADTLNGMMMIPNLIGVLVLCPQVKKCTQNYVDRRIKHKEGITPMLSMDPAIQEEQARYIAEHPEA